MPLRRGCRDASCVGASKQQSCVPRGRPAPPRPPHPPSPLGLCLKTGRTEGCLSDVPHAAPVLRRGPATGTGCDPASDSRLRFCGLPPSAGLASRAGSGSPCMPAPLLGASTAAAASVPAALGLVSGTNDPDGIVEPLVLALRPEPAIASRWSSRPASASRSSEAVASAMGSSGLWGVCRGPAGPAAAGGSPQSCRQAGPAQRGALRGGFA